MAEEFKQQFELGSARLESQTRDTEAERIQKLELKAKEEIEALTKTTLSFESDRLGILQSPNPERAQEAVREKVFEILGNKDTAGSFEKGSADNVIWASRQEKTLKTLKAETNVGEASLQVLHGFETTLQTLQEGAGKQIEQELSAIDQIKEHGNTLQYLRQQFKGHEKGPSDVTWNPKTWLNKVDNKLQEGDLNKRMDIVRNNVGAFESVFNNLNQRLQGMIERKTELIEDGTNLLQSDLDTASPQEKGLIYARIDQEIANPKAGRWGAGLNGGDNSSFFKKTGSIADRLAVYERLKLDRSEDLRKADALQHKQESETQAIADKLRRTENVKPNFKTIINILSDDFKTEKSKESVKLDALVPELAKALRARDIEVNNLDGLPESQQFMALCTLLESKDTLAKLHPDLQSELYTKLIELDKGSDPNREISKDAQESEIKARELAQGINKFAMVANEWGNHQAVKLPLSVGSMSFEGYIPHFEEAKQKFESGDLSDQEKSELKPLWDQLSEAIKTLQEALETWKEDAMTITQNEKARQEVEKRFDESRRPADLKTDGLKKEHLTNALNKNTERQERWDKEKDKAESAIVDPVFKKLEFDGIRARIKIVKDKIDLKAKDNIPKAFTNDNDRIHHYLREEARVEMEEAFRGKLLNSQREQFQMLQTLEEGRCVTITYSSTKKTPEPCIDNLEHQEAAQAQIIDKREGLVILESGNHIILVKDYDDKGANIGIYEAQDLGYDPKESTSIDMSKLPKEANTSAISLGLISQSVVQTPVTLSPSGFNNPVSPPVQTLSP